MAVVNELEGGEFHVTEVKFTSDVGFYNAITMLKL